MDKALVLHRAAGILRKSMADIIDYSDTYISAAKIEVGHCRSEVPDALYDFIVRSTSARDYQNVTTTSEADVPDLRVLEICYNIIALFQNGPTLTLWLALQVHHNVGSMHLMHPLPNTIYHRLDMSMYHGKIFQGKQLKRVVRGIKLVFEALSHDTYHAITNLQHTFRAKDKDSSRYDRQPGYVWSTEALGSSRQWADPSRLHSNSGTTSWTRHTSC